MREVVDLINSDLQTEAALIHNVLRFLGIDSYRTFLENSKEYIKDYIRAKRNSGKCDKDIYHELLQAFHPDKVTHPLLKYFSEEVSKIINGLYENRTSLFEEV